MRGISPFQILIFLIVLNFLLSRQLPFLITQLLTNPLLGASMIIALVIGITVHEFAHALVAYRLGDPTAKIAGRLSLNPLAHLDPLGTLALLFVGFGWGKPTPFDPFNLRNIKRDSALISSAGAISNFLIALLVAIPYVIAFYTHNLTPTFVTFYTYLTPIIFFNLLLAIFNLIPVSPLDGFKVLAGLMPRDWYEDFMQTERYGIFILIILLVTGAISKIVLPIASFLLNLLLPDFVAPF